MKTIYCPHCNGTGRLRDEQALGQTMMARRKAAKKVLREVAASMSVSIGYLSDLEHGRKKWSDQLLARYNRAIAT